MTPPSRVELIMANLGATLRAIEGVRAVVLEAPREGETIRPQSLPHIWCWETGEQVEHGSTGLLQCALSIAAEVVFPTDDRRPLREEGRKWLAQMQRALAQDIGRGFDETVGAALAIDTMEQGNAIAETPAAGYGVAHLDLIVTYHRHYQNPAGLVAVAA